MDIVNAENQDGFAEVVQTTITVPSAEAKPVDKLTGDVNGDGTVNIFDLVIAAGSFGKTGTDIMGDVNGDGGVNIFDLVILAGNFGQSLQLDGKKVYVEIPFGEMEQASVECRALRTSFDGDILG